MFLKYILPVLLCLLLAFFIRKFLCIRGYRNSEEKRIPRIWIILLCLIAFAPIVNYMVFVVTIFCLILCCDASNIHFREKPFKNEKFQNWLLNK